MAVGYKRYLIPYASTRHSNYKSEILKKKEAVHIRKLEGQAAKYLDPRVLFLHHNHTQMAKLF